MIEAVDVDDGLAAIQKHRPHLVLLDLALPRQSGWVVVESMHADDELRDIPVVIVSIRDQAEEQYLGQHVDWVQDYITKPFGMAELETSIKRVLDL